MVSSAFARLVAAVLLALTFCAPLAAQEQQPDNVFPLDVLNEGLPEPAGTIDRSTPRGTLETLLQAAEDERWVDAAHLLNLNGVDVDEQASYGAELAMMLEAVIDRKAVINWTDLIDRPDALDAHESTNSATAGMTRRSILLWTLPLDSRPASLRLERVQVGDEDPVWIFPSQTVQNIGALYAIYGPSELEQAFPEVVKQKVAFGLMLWELVGLPLLIAVAAIVGIMVRYALDFASRRAKTKTMTDVLRAIRGPAIFGTVVTLMALATKHLFVFSGRIDTVLTPAITLGIAASILWLVVNAIDAVLDRLVISASDTLSHRQQQEQRAMATKVAAGRRALIVVFVATAFGIALSSTTLYQNLGLSLIGTAGALTLVFGFAARRVLGNIMASLQIAMNQSARIGDRIVYKDHLCHVERINFTYVQLRDWDGTRLVVPVEEFLSEPFENWTMQEPEMLRVIKLKLAHGADVDRLRAAFDKVVADLDQDELANLDEVSVRVADQDVFGKEVWFCLPCADPNTSWDMACIAREKIIAAAAELEDSDDNRMFPEANPAEAA
ncbi:mechanosensitive ion channel family protein [Psychromarinibacter halotolerans]|uniref:Mechanosensitive ion channel family protein n=1 Tax=Psychromarinibacter halotolerans TaxID=1775175 RepID=A0ABV7GWE0_9RHOB|nr:mechanosensitive ion channel domain-containing protein [Psychromarinibacter halotolerans]MDF0594525.1 mechanosensitive ion channel [Psychromarinibacter halotolerans]